MSLWICPNHGLYGGQIFCPKCGGGGVYAELSPSTKKGLPINLGPSVSTNKRTPV